MQRWLVADCCRYLPRSVQRGDYHSGFTGRISREPHGRGGGSRCFSTRNAFYGRTHGHECHLEGQRLQEGGWSFVPEVGSRTRIATAVPSDSSIPSVAWIAAALVEPVQGEGGCVVPPPGYLGRIKEIRKRNGILFVCDEVQSDRGRCWRRSAIEHFGAIPNILTVAKSLGSGYPISAVTGRADVMNAPYHGGLSGRDSGSAVACTAHLAVRDVIETEGLLDRAVRIGEKTRARLVEMQNDLPVIGNARGLSAMVAMKLVCDPVSKKPATDLTRAYRLRLFENGLANTLAGTHDNVVHCLIPLTIEEKTLERRLAIMQNTLPQVVANVKRTN
jgi:4-aminobutyrate aminotransferase-like enzyme